MTRPDEIHAVLPVKDLEEAKQRLAPILDSAERQGLFRAMLEDVLAAICGAKRVAEVVMVTRHREARAFAERYGVQVLAEAENLGQSAAVTFAAQALGERRVGAMIALPADVPLASADDIDAVLAAHGPAPAVTIAPAHDKLGTNAVVCSPPDVLAFRFGDNSFFPHLDKARALGIEPAVVERTGLALDIDNPADLKAFASRPSETRAYGYLRDAGILARLADSSPRRESR